MINRLAIQLPDWARRSNPVLRYELGKASRMSARARYGRALGVVLFGLLLFGIGYLLATNLLTQSAGQNLTESAIAILFWPLLVIQLLTRVGAILLTAGFIGDEQRRQTWDNLRATQSGAELAMRARWTSVFYRLRGLLAVIIGVRVLLIAGVLFDLTAFQGRYLDLIINGIIPDVSLVVAALLLAFLMTASLLLPITGIGFDAAIGLLVSTVAQQRTYVVLTQIMVVIARVAIVGALVYGVTRFVNGGLETSDAGAWLLTGGFAALGDWGLRFLNLGFYGEIWATVSYGVFLGLGLLVFAMVEAALTDGILALAARRAQKKG